MAEKEERIAIAKMITELDDDGSAHLDHFKIYSRAEAIERMAKALFNFQYDGGLSFENAYDGAKKEFRLFAESALNALLSK